MSNAYPDITLGQVELSSPLQYKWQRCSLISQDKGCSSLPPTQQQLDWSMSVPFEMFWRSSGLRSETFVEQAVLFQSREHLQDKN